jgi:hypothetical protein
VRIGYLVVSHREPQQVLRLVRVLTEAPTAEVVVRHDQRRSALARDEVEAAGGWLLDDELDNEWAGWGHVEVLLEGLRQFDTDWVLVLSGQDYPLRPLAELEAFLGATDHDALLADAWELDLTRRPEPAREEFFMRHAYRHYRRPPGLGHLPGRLRPFVYTREMPPRLGVRRLGTPFGSVFVSADWLTLSRRAVASLERYVREESRAMRFFRRVAVPSESLFATALMTDEQLDVGLDHRRFFSFPGPGAAHPDTLTSADLPELERSNAFFARKFDAGVDVEVLDALDRRRRNAPSAR